MKHYRSVVRTLKQKYPAPLPVSVRRLRLPDDLDGDCQHKGDHFLIRINRELVEHEAIETFLHEYAHAQAWDTTKDDHCARWGIAYSRVYRTFLKEFFGDHNVKRID